MSVARTIFLVATLVSAVAPVLAQEQPPAEQTSVTSTAASTAATTAATTATSTPTPEVPIEAVQDTTVEEISIVGSHINRGRTVIASPVAVDVLDAQSLANETGHLDLNRMLHVAAPSFNATRQSGADGADHIDPATLRGLGPDQTLVLINGKRHHQSSLINIFGSRGRGNTGSDLNAIPVAAIDRIEILRDGASAIYGSDAIAGVINIVLRKDVGPLDVWVNSGVHNAKPPSQYDVVSTKSFDGETIGAAANYGIRVGDGFANFTVDYNKLEHTNRAANPDKFSAYRRQFGDAAVDSFGLWVNSQVPLKDLEFYAFGGGGYRDTNAYAWTRDPDSDRNVMAIYPGGFDPQITSRITDVSVSAGVRAHAGSWDLDLNNTFGQNRFHYFIENTLNASLLEKSPTRFDAGGHVFSQNVTGVHFSRPVEAGPVDVYVALGAEFRIDDYGIFAGEEGSYRNYGLQQQVVDGQVTMVDTLMRPGGSQGFPGYRPDNVVDESRTNFALYAEGGFDLTRDLLVETAARFEQYSDFGGTLNAKAAARYELARMIGVDALKHLVLRGSVSSGFRAPSLAQIYYNTTFTDFVSGVPIDKLIAKNDSPVTRTLGISQLKEEKSINASVGVTAEVQGLKVTVDGYYVDIKDRIVLTGAFGSDDPDIGPALTALNVGAAQFFANALDTRTLGVDVVGETHHDFGAHQVRVQLGANFNRMELGDLEVGPKLMGKEDTFFGEREKKFLLASAPKSKLTLSLGYRFDPIFANAIFTRYDQVEFVDWLDTPDIYEPKITSDLNVGWKVNDDLTLIVGGMNIFNVYPTQQDTETETGGLWDSVQMGNSGAFYYAKLNARI